VDIGSGIGSGVGAGIISWLGGLLLGTQDVGAGLGVGIGSRSCVGAG
jgi:hypothetical protein